MKLVEGMTAVVTGASRGLGVDIARRLAARGCDLVLTARSGAALEAVASAIRAEFRREVAVCTADVGDVKGVEGLAEHVAGLGGADVLVNNAGVETTAFFDERDPAEIVRTLTVNLASPMLLTRALLPGMLQRGRGHIVNVASIAGVLPLPFNEPYTATKYGVVGFTRSLRLSAQARGWPVSASAVCPGFIGGAGIFEDMQRDYGVSTEGLSVCGVEEVGPAVVRAIEEDLPDVYVANDDVRPVVASLATDPAAFEAGSMHSPETALLRVVAEARRPKGSAAQ